MESRPGSTRSSSMPTVSVTTGAASSCRTRTITRSPASRHQDNLVLPRKSRRVNEGLLMSFQQKVVPGPFKGIVDNMRPAYKPDTAFDDLQNLFVRNGRLIG